MEQLPFVDRHLRHVAATPERTWNVLVALARTRLGRPAPAAFVALWQLEPVSGFAIAEEHAPQRLVLRGHHRFSQYELVFEVEPSADGVTLSARTLAAFPGLAGRAYRALVIGSGGHGLIVRQMLAQVAHLAERRSPAS